jgi:hypothetical protein
MGEQESNKHSHENIKTSRTRCEVSTASPISEACKIFIFIVVDLNLHGRKITSLYTSFRENKPQFIIVAQPVITTV